MTNPTKSVAGETLAPSSASLANELHALAMNIPCGEYEGGSAFRSWSQNYRFGHRDARHAIAEAVLSHPGVMEVDALRRRLGETMKHLSEYSCDNEIGITNCIERGSFTPCPTCAARVYLGSLAPPLQSSGEPGEPGSRVRQWVELRNLRCGAIFETKSGIRAVKSEYHYSDVTQCECVLLESGEYAHFPLRNREPVREIVLDPVGTLLDLIRRAMPYVEQATPSSCGACGTPNASCDMDCVAHAHGMALLDEMRRVFAPSPSPAEAEVGK